MKDNKKQFFDFKYRTKQGIAPVSLSIKDWMTTDKVFSTREEIEISIEMAKFPDHRGFVRYWLAEHHSMFTVSTSSQKSTLLVIDIQEKLFPKIFKKEEVLQTGHLVIQFSNGIIGHFPYERIPL